MHSIEIADHNIVLLGCGKMGFAILSGWLKNGLPMNRVWVLDPCPSADLRFLASQGLNLNSELPERPSVCLIAVKPQIIESALTGIRTIGDGATILVSLAAGTPISVFERHFGENTPIVRAMPNIPVAIGQGITALTWNGAVTSDQLKTVCRLLEPTGSVVLLDGEHQIDAVTAVSGSGPAYVFHFIEALAAAGVAEGLPIEMALKLAIGTVRGSGNLAYEDEAGATQLRKNVSSPNGTTEAALSVLMDDKSGFPALLRQAVGKATKRSKELSFK